MVKYKEYEVDDLLEAVDFDYPKQRVGGYPKLPPTKKLDKVPNRYVSFIYKRLKKGYIVTEDWIAKHCNVSELKAKALMRDVPLLIEKEYSATVFKGSAMCKAYIQIRR